MTLSPSTLEPNERTRRKEATVHDRERTIRNQRPQLVCKDGFVRSEGPKAGTDEDVRTKRHERHQPRERITARAVPARAVVTEVLTILGRIRHTNARAISAVERQPTPIVLPRARMRPRGRMRARGSTIGVGWRSTALMARAFVCRILPRIVSTSVTTARAGTARAVIRSRGW